MTATIPERDADDRPSWGFNPDLWAGWEDATGVVQGPPGEPSRVDFWDKRPALAHIRDFARARRVAPWAVLGATLTRVVACCPPSVQLPPIIGSHASINLFAALTGPSGAGKDAANKVARDTLDLGEHATFKVAPLGSGEALSHMFMTLKDGELTQYNEAALVTVGEIDTMTALVKRQASTVGSQLRQAAMGEQLGFFYVDVTKRMLVPEHRYRLCLVAGVQPKRAGALLDEADGGTPQRFMWLPATDPDAPDIRPPEPKPMIWVPPVWHEIGGGWSDGMYRNVIDVCDTAVEVIDSAHLARTRGTGEALDGHALLTRLKVAAALALLEGRAEVRDDDWALSGEVMVVSDATRDMVQRVLTEVKRQEHTAQAEAEAAKTILISDRQHEATMKRVTRVVANYLAGSRDWVTHSDLRASLASRDRAHFQAAVLALLASGQIEDERFEHRGQEARRYRLSRMAA